MGFKEESSDLASLAYETYLKKGNTKQNFKYAIIDAIRRDGWGNRDNIQRDVLKSAVHSKCEISYKSNFGVLNDIEIHLKFLKREERVIFILRYYWSLTESEIGYVLGVSESRICQKLKQIHKILDENIDEKSIQSISQA